MTVLTRGLTNDPSICLLQWNLDKLYKASATQVLTLCRWLGVDCQPMPFVKLDFVAFSFFNALHQYPHETYQVDLYGLNN